MIGTSISRYDILEELGQGGMSVVYLARDSALNRQVAIKLLHEHLAKKPENRMRFRREAEAIARLRHPNIVDVYDVGEDDDERSFIVMEYIPGSNLRQFIDDNGPPPPEIAALIGVQICNALAQAHKHGVIHRDLKPENVMVSRGGQVKLMDFGIAHVIDAETMTKTGSLLGSPAHMAPELIDGQKVDERADIFALGTVLYWMSTGQLPFCGDNTPQVLRNVMECRYEEPELVQPKMSHDLARIICKSLHKSPDDRDASVDAVKRELLAAVHAVGFDDDEALLADYFADPARFSARFDEDIVARLIARGKRAMERRRVPVAIAYFNRVLAYDAQNEEVRECLAQLNRNRQVWRLAAVVASVCVFAGGVWLIYHANKADERAHNRDVASQKVVVDALERARQVARVFAVMKLEQQRVRKAQASATRALARTTAQRNGARRGLHISAQVGELVTKPEIRRLTRLNTIANVTTAKLVGVHTDAASEGDPDTADAGQAPAQTIAVQFKVFPPSARLEIDGEKVTWQLGTFELTRGKHLIKASAPGCKPYRRFMVVNQPRAGKIPVVLDWKDAVVTVVADRNVLVYVNGEANPRANARRTTIRVPFRRHRLDESATKKTVKLRINDSTNLQRVETREVVVGPGDEHTEKVTFQ